MEDTACFLFAVTFVACGSYFKSFRFMMIRKGAILRDPYTCYIDSSQHGGPIYKFKECRQWNCLPDQRWEKGLQFYIFVHI